MLFYSLAECLFFKKDTVYLEVDFALVSCYLVAITNTCLSGPSVILVSLVTIALVRWNKCTCIVHF